MIPLTNEHLEWAKGVADGLADRLPRTFQREDLWQVARIAVWHCTEQYDPSRGVPWEAYACPLVRWAVLMSIRRRPYLEAKTSVPFEGTTPARPEACSAVRPNHDDRIAAGQRTRIIADALWMLPERERAVVAAAFLLDAPMTLLAERLDVSLSSAYAYRTRGLELLRDRLQMRMQACNGGEL